MVSKEPSKCALTTSASEVEPAACLALEMKYALDPNRQIKKRNKALQVRFKDICEAQNEQRATQLSSAQLGDKPASYRATHRKYMTVPARRSIPNVTKSTGVQTSPDLKKCYQTFPPDRKKGSLKGIPAADAFKSQNSGCVLDAKEKSEEGPREESRQWGADRARKTAALVFHSDGHVNALGQPAGVNCAEPCKTPDLHRCRDAPLQNSTRPPSQEPDYQLHGKAKHDRATPDAEEPAASAHGMVFETEVATVSAPAAGAGAPELALSNSAPSSGGPPLCPVADQEPRKASQANGLQAPPGAALACSPPRQCLSPECGEASLQTQAPPGQERQPRPTAPAAGEECQQIVPHTEVGDLKAQLQVMENLISSSQETIKVLLGVIQELEKGEAHREGLSYRTGQDTANCDTCRNSACIIYSVELDFKQQEDKLQPVLRKLHPFEETQVAHSPYSQETYSTPKQKPKTESKKHGRWKLWFL
ncbi:inhibitory synaptic factor 2A [Kogia breviceps]|uniref:inhibitory synaptic factor 2A n=1 Tax=Kogia breviceps TaxID=27615 RepID=UPI0027960243|nr:inhibitory synaptic factor 2A [Kogia breviceps]